MATRRKKSYIDIMNQRNRIQDLARELEQRQRREGRHGDATRTSERSRAAMRTASRYVSNIERLKSQQNMFAEWNKAYERDDRDEQKRIANKANTTKYSRRTYMGLSKG